MYDVVVIGCGPGGYAAAIRASQLGGKVAVVEAGEVGGTCVSRGCIPSKVWLKAASMLGAIQRGQEFGIQVATPKIDFKAIVERKSTVAGEIRMGMEALLQNNQVERITGHAELKNARELKVDGKGVEAKNIILATGSILDIPDIPGLKDALLTSDDLFDSTELPAVEYRVCPIATLPGSSRRTDGGNTSCTRPMPRWQRTSPPISIATIPADSCPRCWSAYRPKYASSAAFSTPYTPMTPHMIALSACCHH